MFNILNVSDNESNNIIKRSFDNILAKSPRVASETLGCLRNIAVNGSNQHKVAIFSSRLPIMLDLVNVCTNIIYLLKARSSYYEF